VGTVSGVADVSGFVTRAVVVPLDPSPAQERLLRSYCGAARFAYNWALNEVVSNMNVRAVEVEQFGTAATSSVSWSKFSLRKQFNASKAEVAPWSGEVAKYCFDTGVSQAAQALENWSKSKNGTRAGKRVGFPKFKSRDRAKLSVTFVELNHQLSWLRDDRHGIRLPLPASMGRNLTLGWVHTSSSTRRLYSKVAAGGARIQSVTVSYTGGRWQAAFCVRYKTLTRPHKTRRKHAARTAGIDLGVTHLATLSEPIDGVTDEHGHVANPRVLQHQLARLEKVDRQIARCQKGSKNRRRHVKRRARLHGSIASTRKMCHHMLANELAGRFDTIAIEDLNVAGMIHNRSLARALSDAGLGQFVQILRNECVDRGTRLVQVSRWFPSSKTCSNCGAVKAKLFLDARVFDCINCGVVLDRDVNAAHNIAVEADRLTRQQEEGNDVAGLRPETQNGDQSTRQTKPATAGKAVCNDGATMPATTATCGTSGESDMDVTLATMSS